MALKIDTIEHACNLISREIKDYQRNLTIQYIVHHEGQRTEALALAAQKFLGHPASETAMHLLQAQRKSEYSALLGSAVARNNMLFGLASKDFHLALCTINIDEFNSLKEMQRQAYHLAWHALDNVEYHADPQNNSGRAKENLVRKRNGLEIAHANLKADVFSACMGVFHRDRDAAQRISKTRSENTIATRALYSPEFSPFPIALDATVFAIDKADPKNISKKRMISEAQKITSKVGQIYGSNSVTNWIKFCEPAQDMAWRNFSDEEILGAAIHTSPDTYVRATGYLVAEQTGTSPASVLDIRESYSPFADDEFNSNIHDRVIDQTFNDIIAQVARSHSASPLFELAHQQNEALTNGHILGWCASALQAAGVAVLSGIEQGEKSPEDLAAERFRDQRNHTNWEELSLLGKNIIKSQRSGQPVTMRDIDDLAKDIAGLKALRASVQNTLEAPEYTQQLAAVSELDSVPAQMIGMEAAPSVTKPAPVAAQPIVAPGLGGTSKPIKQNTAQESETDSRT